MRTRFNNRTRHWSIIRRNEALCCSRRRPGTTHLTADPGTEREKVEIFFLFLILVHPAADRTRDLRRYGRIPDERNGLTAQTYFTGKHNHAPRRQRDK